MTLADACACPPHDAQFYSSCVDSPPSLAPAHEFAFCVCFMFSDNEARTLPAAPPPKHEVP